MKGECLIFSKRECTVNEQLLIVSLLLMPISYLFSSVSLLHYIKRFCKEYMKFWEFDGLWDKEKIHLGTGLAAESLLLYLKEALCLLEPCPLFYLYHVWVWWGVHTHLVYTPPHKITDETPLWNMHTHHFNSHLPCKPGLDSSHPPIFNLHWSLSRASSWQAKTLHVYLDTIPPCLPWSCERSDERKEGG